MRVVACSSSPIPSFPDKMVWVGWVFKVFGELVIHDTYSLGMCEILCCISGTYFGFNFELIKIELFVTLNLVSLEVVAGMA